MTRKAEEHGLLQQLFDTHGYRVLEMERARERTIGAFTRRGSRMTYSTAVVVRLVVPTKSWLGSAMQGKRSREKRRVPKSRLR